MSSSADAPIPPAATDRFAVVDGYWRAANYLSVGQIYLLDNPLLREPLSPQHVKPRLLGHFGTVPGLNLIYAHLNAAIRARDLNAIYIAGPGHGGPGVVANAYLEGTYTELYPNITRDEDGLRALFRQFSFPGGIPSHAAPETPGSIHEGGELGYSLAHAFGAAFDNPDLVVACVVGDGEAETGALAASWQSTRFLDPAGDGAVLPILHLNGYKIANPTVLARISEEELISLLRGGGWEPVVVRGGEDGEPPAAVHGRMAEALGDALDGIARVQQQARAGDRNRHRWPMLVLRTPKGWTGPSELDGLPVEGSWRSHQVPVTHPRTDPVHLRALEDWLRSYRPEELFDESGAVLPQLTALAPSGERRMSANPHANRGTLLRDLVMPDFRDYAVEVDAPGKTTSEPTRVLGQLLRDIAVRNRGTFRVFGPDETASNRLSAVFEATDWVWEADILPTDDHLGRRGQVMEVLSEHLCQGWLEGYLLTGRDGLFNCYEAFIHIVDSMFNQHANWLKVTRGFSWRPPIASLNYLLSSHVWRQDHNGFSHQDPGFIDHVANKGGGRSRVPAAGRELPAVGGRPLPAQPPLRQRGRRRQAAEPRLPVHGGRDHPLHAGGGDLGLGVERPGRRAGRRARLLRRRAHAGNRGRGSHPARAPSGAGGAGRQRRRPDAPPAADRAPARPVRSGLRRAVHHRQPGDLRPPRLSVADPPVDLPAHQPRQHPRARVQGGGHDHHALRHGELNDLDRYHLVMDVIDRVPGLIDRAGDLRQEMGDARVRARVWTREHGDDHPDIRDWAWPF